MNAQWFTLVSHCSSCGLRLCDVIASLAVSCWSSPRLAVVSVDVLTASKLLLCGPLARASKIVVLHWQLVLVCKVTHIYLRCLHSTDIREARDVMRLAVCWHCYRNSVNLVGRKFGSVALHQLIALCGAMCGPLTLTNSHQNVDESEYAILYIFHGQN